MPPPKHPLRTVVLRASCDETSDLRRLLSDCSTSGARRLSSALALAVDWGGRLPLPGTGSTIELWEALATVAAVDLQVARVLEPHLDARAILAQAGRTDLPHDSTWGVYAAEGPGPRLQATPIEVGTTAGWSLSGHKPWCSLADRVDRALVTAWVDETQSAADIVAGLAAMQGSSLQAR